MKIKYFIYSLALLLCVQSCDIDEEIKDESLGEDLLSTASVEALLAPSYSISRRMYGHRVLFATSVYASDEGMLPKRLDDWFDGGVFEDLQKHQWLPTHPYITWLWGDISSGIGRTIKAIEQLPPGPEASEAMGLLGLYMFQGLDNFNQVPYFDIDNIDFTQEAEILKGAEAVDKIIFVLEKAISGLPAAGNKVRFTQDAAKALLSRLYLNKAVYADRYASSFNHSDADLNEVISNAGALISGGYALTPNFFDLFALDNDSNNTEIIFSLRNERNSPPVRGGHSVTRHTTNSQSRGLLLTDIFQVGGYLGGSDAGCTLPGFFNTWDQTDSRFFKVEAPVNLNTLVGHTPSSAAVTAAAAGDYTVILDELKALPDTSFYKDIAVGSVDTKANMLTESLADVTAQSETKTWDVPVIRWTVPVGTTAGSRGANRGFITGNQFGPYVLDTDAGRVGRSYHYVTVDGEKSIVFSALRTKTNAIVNHTIDVKYDAGSQTTGVRVAKYEVDVANKNRDDTKVDIPVFRLAEMYLNRAEAYLRLASPNVAAASADLNAVRQARNPGWADVTATLDLILKERGFEFYWEYHRRTDQIRFGTWEDTWQSKTSTDVNKRLYPIPPQDVAFNPGIEQNPGY